MGNSPSSPSSHDQYPLSKPSTDAWNSKFLSTAARDEKNSVSTTLSNPVQACKPSSSGNSSLTQEERNKLRSDIFGFGGEVTYQGSGETYREGHDLAEVVNCVKDRRPRSDSLISQGSNLQMLSIMNPAAASNMSLVTEPRGELDLAAVVHILQELKKTASPEDLIALHKALLPTRKQESGPESPVKAVPAPEIARGASTRRSGLHIPGFATRGSTDVLRKLLPVRGIQPLEEESPAWKRELPDLPITPVAAVHNEHNEREISGPRPLTPGDLDYARIGEKLGPLRVINGAATPERCATPTPGAPACLQFIDNHVEDGYYTASEGRVSPEDAFHQQQSGAKSSDGHSHKLSSLDAQQSTVHSHSHSEPVSAAAEALTEPPRRRSHSDSDKIYLSGPDYVVKTQITPDVTSSLALDYMAELCSSPYTRTNSPSQTTISSPTEEIPRSGFLIAGSSTPKPLPPVVEPLLAMTMLTLEPSHAEGWCGFMNENRGEQIPGAQMNMSRTFHLREPTKTSSIYVEEARSSGSDKRASLVQTDSGYDSETSVNVAKERLSQDDYQPNLASLELSKVRKNDYSQKPLPEFADPDETRSLYTLEEMLRNTAPPSTRKQIINEDRSQSLKKSTSRFQRLRSKSFKKDLKKSAPSSPLAESTASLALTVTKKSAKSDAAFGPRKLQKQRPLSQVVLTASIGLYGTKEASRDVIPSVPDDVAQSFVNRAPSIPSAEFLKRSYEAPTPAASRVASLSAENLNAASKPPAYELAMPDVAQRSWFPRKGSASKPPNTPLHPNGSSLDVKQPSPDSEDGITAAEEQLMNGVADFGTVANHLGRSPYDIAMSTTRPKSTPVAPHQILHPYQMGAFFPRPKLMMNEEMAAEFARRRSHDLQNTRLTRSFTRSRSYHGQDFDDQGDTGGRNIRPHSIYTDVPPVPALPTGRVTETSSPAVSDGEKAKGPEVLGREDSCPPDSMAGSPNGPGHARNTPSEPVERRFELDGGSSHQPLQLDAGLIQQLQRPRSVGPTMRHQSSNSLPSTNHRDFAVTASNPPPPPPKAGPEERAASYREFQRRSFVEGTPQYNAMHKQWPLDQSEQQTLPPPRLPSAPPSIIVSQGPAGHVIEEPRIENTKPVAVGSQQIDWEAEAALWRKRRQSVGKGLLQENVAQKRGSGNNSPTKVTPAHSPTPSLKLSDTSASQGSIASIRRPELSRSKSSGEAIFDRYSGGFEYDYEHGFGFGGSAGTRSVWSEASRKSQHYSVQHGLDLSDVPVFLQKA